MTASLGRVIAVALAVNLAQGCAREASSGARTGGHSYIYAFAGDDDKRAGDSDFLAVIDADPASPSYARVLASAPIHAVGTMPHHMELTMPGNGQWLFANGFMSGRTARSTLSWDSTFRDPDSKRLGVDFDRASWPHGASGPAMPHGAVFGVSDVGRLH